MPENIPTIYKFLSETADKRTKQYKHLQKHLDELVAIFGKDSKEVNDFFNTPYLPYLY